MRQEPARRKSAPHTPNFNISMAEERMKKKNSQGNISKYGYLSS